MTEHMSSLRSLKVCATLIPVQMAVADSVILEASLVELSDDVKPLLRGFLRLKLVFLDMSACFLLSLHSPGHG